MTSAPNRDLLKHVAFFHGLPETLLWNLGRIAEARTLSADELLFREGEARQFFGVVLTGTLAIEHGVGHERLAALGAGETYLLSITALRADSANLSSAVAFDLAPMANPIKLAFF